MSAEKLYTPEMLAAAVELAKYPPVESAALHGAARSPACGSTLAVDLSLDAQQSIDRIGLKVRACAVGQAAAAVFARHAAGRSIAEVCQAHDALAAWLEGASDAPDWPDIDLIVPARDYRGRHGAMLLPWKAAMEALSSAAAAS
ncbi:iron-sulfur cluster assembly scaffold protein [Aurantiacibacter sp. MUD11]|uniref:iron-sulfur cluster assembly scaffold protein n=1 Tax=Aurantiacibacter sp. MUD11 TaxID=3003265 RepID=UPI0022AAD8E9|nr:iron-sulfur cluster assembly scaffold protein [Aurantiacibacter sp. MUD11]WAT18359.1 iron-sulfur cluster assembly scaffold protein [Aurantiacibacter sp. MUD11]